MTHFKDLNDLADEIMKVNEAKGWNDAPERVGTPDWLAAQLCLIHSEVSEALEDVRDGKLTQTFEGDGRKPCGLPSELADIIIRTLHLSSRLDINIRQAVSDKIQYNWTRPIRHGGKAL